MGKVAGILFCGLFCAVGIGIFAFKSVPTVVDWIDAKSWIAVDAQLISHDLKVSHGDDSTTYKATVRYSYDYYGQSYTGDRVGLSGGSDNISDYHQDWDQRFRQIASSGMPFTVYVDPEQPSDSLVDRNLRWGLLAFESLFLLVFGGFGLGGIWLILRGSALGKKQSGVDPSTPWLEYKEWAKPVRTSDIGVGNKVLLGFAVIWNLISLPAAFAAFDEVQKDNYLALIALVFPAVGIFLLSFWWKSHKSYRLTGPMELAMDPFPGSLGGQVGGIITLARPLTRAPKRSSLKLQCVRNYRSGKNNRQEMIWEDTMIPKWEGGRRLLFCFDAPETQRESSPPYSRPGYEWKVLLDAETDDGLKIAREYSDLPVFRTQEQSGIRDRAALASTSIATQEAHTSLVESVLDLQLKADGYHLYYPAFRNAWGLAVFLVGAVFVVAGVMIPDLIFNIVFPLLGLPVAIGGIYAFINSLDIRFGPEGITAQRRLLGIPLKPKFLPSYSFREFKEKKSHATQTGSKHTQYYSIEAHGNQGEKLVVAEDLKGKAELEAAIDKLDSILHYR